MAKLQGHLLRYRDAPEKAIQSAVKIFKVKGKFNFANIFEREEQTILYKNIRLYGEITTDKLPSRLFQLFQYSNNQTNHVVEISDGGKITAIFEKPFIVKNIDIKICKKKLKQEDIKIKIFAYTDQRDFNHIDEFKQVNTGSSKNDPLRFQLYLNEPICKVEMLIIKQLSFKEIRIT
jgi:hypothetical protein